MAERQGDEAVGPDGPLGTGNLLGLDDADDEDRKTADVVLFGVPSNAGADGRLGADAGPARVRDASWTFGSYSHALGLDIFDEMVLVDGGDLAFSHEQLDAAEEAVQARVFELSRGGQIPGMIGGTQALTLGALRGILQAKRRPVKLLHLTPCHGLRRDTQGESGMLRRALDENLLKTGGVMQVGVRGPGHDADEQRDALGAGFERLAVDDVRFDVHGSMAAVRKAADGAPIYLSVDLASLDPSVCPGVTRPAPGGLTAWETQQVLRCLVGSDIVGFDVVGSCPRWDTSELTSVMAVAVLHEILAVVAHTRGGARISLVGGSVGRTSA